VYFYIPLSGFLLCQGVQEQWTLEVHQRQMPQLYQGKTKAASGRRNVDEVETIFCAKK